MEKVCQVCGDGSAGFAHLIVTCTKCCSSHEHVYCMREHTPGHVPADWICESCDLRSETNNPAAVAVPQTTVVVSHSTSRQYQLKKTGKVKFISPEEVIHHSSGSPMKTNFLRKLRSGPPRSGRNMNNSSSSSSRMRSSSAAPTRQKHIRLSEVFYSSPKTPVTRPPPRNFATHLGCKSKKVAEHDPQGESMLEIKRIVSLYGSYLPAKHAIWKGEFNIVDVSVGGNTTSETFQGLQAQPPSIVRRRAYETSQKIPPILQVKIIPLAQCLADRFLDNYVDLHHIGLYFFPSVLDDGVQRSRYDELLERMERRESAMIGHVNEVELIIFTSKQLKVDLKGKNFFWGLLYKPSPSKSKAPLGSTWDNEGDMEVDMVGGENVGRMDVVVRKEDVDSSLRTTKQMDEAQVQESLKRLEQLSCAVNNAADCPPGFAVAKKEGNRNDEGVRGKRLKTEAQ